MTNPKQIHEMSKKHDEILERLRNNKEAYNFIMKETLFGLFKFDDTKETIKYIDVYLKAIEDYLNKK